MYYFSVLLERNLKGPHIRLPPLLKEEAIRHRGLSLYTHRRKTYNKKKSRRSFVHFY